MEQFQPDERGLRVLSRLATWSDDAVLREVAAEIESEGIEVVESTLFLASILTPQGLLTGRNSTTPFGGMSSTACLLPGESGASILGRRLL